MNPLSSLLLVRITFWFSLQNSHIYMEFYFKVSHAHHFIALHIVQLSLYGPSKYIIVGCSRSCTGRLKYKLSSQHPTGILWGPTLLSNVMLSFQPPRVFVFGHFSILPSTLIPCHALTMGGEIYHYHYLEWPLLYNKHVSTSQKVVLKLGFLNTITSNKEWHTFLWRMWEFIIK